MTTTVPIPARARLRAAHVALEAAHAAFQREACNTPESARARLAWLREMIVQLRQMVDLIAEVRR